MAKGDSYAASQLFMGLTPKNGFKASKLYCYKPTDGSGDFTWARNINSYRLNQSGNLELMGNNVPRIDYTNTCPELLIEGERENLLLRSQEIDNAYWTKNNISVNTNTAIAPDGTLTAEEIESTINGQANIQRTLSLAVNTTVTLTCFAKYIDTRYLVLYLYDNGSVLARQWFDIQNGTVGTTENSGFSSLSATISEAGNGYYRLSFTGTTPNTTGVLVIFYELADANGILGSNIGDSAYFWGAQLEEGSYPTSYIPTTTASVTRPQDTNSSDIAFTGDGFSYNLRVRLENRSDSGTPDNIFFIEDISGTSDTYAGIYVLGDSLYFTFYNNPDIEEYSITLPDGIHNLGVSLDCNNGAYEIVVDGVSEFSGALTNGFNSANIYERVKLGCLAASTDSIGLNRIIGLQVYDAVLTQGELIEYTS
jgi:hypothetical protein